MTIKEKLHEIMKDPVIFLGGIGSIGTLMLMAASETYVYCKGHYLEILNAVGAFIQSNLNLTH